MKRICSGPTRRIKNNMSFGFREKGGEVKFELKIREKGQFSRASDEG